MHHGFDPGTEVGGFFAGDVVGAGGASVVQRAWDPRVGRAVALKVLDGSGWDPAVRDRFEREVRMGGGLTHPNIVPVLDAGEHGGHPWIAMQFIEGPTLAAIIARDGRLSYPRMVKIASDIAAALDFAHQRGIVHRDVKPGNILVMEGSGAGGADHAYLADFGITRAMADAELVGGAATVLGTPAYIAPEQRAGGVIDGRADVYALACVIFEMLTGAPPFGRAPEPGRHVMPSLVAVRADVSPAADLALRAALAQDPDFRPATAGQLIAALATQPVAPTVPLAPTAQAAWAGPEIWQGPATMAIPTTTTTASVTRRKSRTGPMLVLFLGVFVVTMLGLFAVSGLGGPPAQTGASVTPAQAVTSTPLPTRHTPKKTPQVVEPPPPTPRGGGTTVVTDGLTAAEEDLRRDVPDPVASMCRHYTFDADTDALVPDATAALECDDPDGRITAVRYYRMPSLSALREQFDRRNAELGIGPEDDGCWVGETGLGLHRRGELSCLDFTSRKRQIRWTDEDRLIYGFIENDQARTGTYWPATLAFFRQDAVLGGTSIRYTDDERRLKPHLPSAIAGSCMPYMPQAGGFTVEEAVAAFQCDTPDGHLAFYFQLESSDGGRSFFAGRQRDNEGERIPTGDGGCRDGLPGDATFNDDPIFCWVNDPRASGAQARMRWLDQAQQLYVGVNAPDGDTDILGLLDWWQAYALPR